MAAAPRRSADRALLRNQPARSAAVKRAAVLTAEQIASMLAAASPRDAALVVLMCVGAMRVGEAVLLAWGYVEAYTIAIAGPITKTGHCSHFIHPSIIEDAGGPVAYVLAWIKRAAYAPHWLKIQTLF